MNMNPLIAVDQLLSLNVEVVQVSGVSGEGLRGEGEEGGREGGVLRWSICHYARCCYLSCQIRLHSAHINLVTFQTK